jgi:hypothetical protein
MSEYKSVNMSFTIDEISLACSLIRDAWLGKWVSYKSYKIKVALVLDTVVGFTRPVGNGSVPNKKEQLYKINLIYEYYYTPWGGFFFRSLKPRKYEDVVHRQYTPPPSGFFSTPPHVTLGSDFFWPDYDNEVKLLPEDDQVMLDFQAMMTAKHVED